MGSAVNPFASAHAFDSFYDRTVAVEGVRQGKSLRGQYRACVDELGFADPLGDSDSSSDRRAVSILVPRRGEGAWIGGRPQVGDIVRIDGLEVRFRVSRVSLPLGQDWQIEARQA